MDEYKKHKIITVIIVVITLAAIVCVHKGLGYFLRHAQVTEVYCVYQRTEIVGTTKENWGFGEEEVLIPEVKRSEGWEKRPLDEPSIQGILSVIDVAFIGVGIFAYLILLSIENQEDQKTIKLFCLLGVFILLAVIGIFSMYRYYVNKTRTEEHIYDANEKVPIRFLDDEQLCETGVLQNFRISGDTAA